MKFSTPASVFRSKPLDLPLVQPAIQPQSSAQAYATSDWNQFEANMVRRIGFFIVLGFLFLRVTALHELLTTQLGFNTFILYPFAIPSMLCMFLSGSLQRTFRTRQAQYWLAFLFLFYVSIVFSQWPGGSAHIVMTYTRTEFVVLPLVGGLLLTWKDFSRAMTLMGIAGCCSIIIGFFFVSGLGADRTEMSFGTMSNANDFAAHLIFVLPFVAFLVCTKRAVVIRVFAAALIPLGLYRILSTGSRGALVALMIAAFYLFLSSSLSRKVILVILGLAMGIAVVSFIPESTTQRLKSLFVSEEEETQIGGSAQSSREARSYLFRRSIDLTIKYPIFGVGPGEFADTENKDSQAVLGIKGAWHETHNAYTQVSSEAGIPALLCFLGGILSTFIVLRKTYKKALHRPPSPFRQKVLISIQCLMVSMIGFGSASLFLSLAYLYYFPLFSALGLVVFQAVEHEWQLEDRAVTANVSR